ncbi:hypothetical protein AB4Z35_31185, partial [Pseudomonas sp. KB_15]|uniref:hypothetical protein n=1 Tax=Pseudomonas sp. KB_15 TaxID=3233035 RepID=UPI003F9C46CB
PFPGTGMGASTTSITSGLFSITTFICHPFLNVRSKIEKKNSSPQRFQRELSKGAQFRLAGSSTGSEPNGSEIRLQESGDVMRIEIRCNIAVNPRAASRMAAKFACRNPAM